MNKPLYVRGLLLLVLALVSAGLIIVCGIRSGLSPWIIAAVVAAIFNVLLLVYSLSKPLCTDDALRRTLQSIFLQDWFYIGGALALSYGRYAAAGVAVVGGGIVHLLITRKYARRLRHLCH